MAILAEAIHHRQDHRLPSHTGQGFHEVQAEVAPDCRGHRQWQEEACRVEVLGLVPLARVTGTDEVLYQATHVGKVKVATKPMQRALHTLMTVLVYGSEHLL
jgi:hypothetical protein